MKDHNRSKNTRSIVSGNSEALVAAVPKDAFRAMFHLFAGRPDSKTKAYSKRFCLNSEDVFYLNEKIIEKLSLHNIDQVVASATLKLKNKEIIQFGTWAELESFDWNNPAPTQEFSLRWDFLIKVDEYAAAQRHTLTVKIIKSPSTKDMFQAMLNSDQDEDSEDLLGSCIARVDFISHRLADELIAIVSEWNEYLTPCKFEKSWINVFEPHDRKIAFFTHYSIPVMLAIVAIATLNKISPTESELLKTDFFIFGIQWLLGSAVLVYVTTQLSRRIATRMYTSINEFGRYSPFSLTKGDLNELDRLAENDRSSARSFLYSNLLSFFINVAAGIATYILLK